MCCTQNKLNINLTLTVRETVTVSCHKQDRLTVDFANDKLLYDMQGSSIYIYTYVHYYIAL